MLPLRICLILAILAGLGVIGITHFVVRPHVDTIITERNDNKTGWEKSKEDNRKLTKTLKETETELKSTKMDLETTKTQVTELTGELTSVKAKSKQQGEQIVSLTASLKKKSDDLAAWEAVGLTVDQVNGVVKREKDLTAANASYLEENKLFLKEITRLTNQLAVLLGDKEVDPVVPPGVRGKVMVVDPKWDFLVLDVGSKIGLVNRGVLLISRNGALVAKVRVLNVQQDRCIANIMPGWKLKDVMEGDQVFPYAPGGTL
jgi:hypothetical protein